MIGTLVFKVLKHFFYSQTFPSKYGYDMHIIKSDDVTKNFSNQNKNPLGDMKRYLVLRYSESLVHSVRSVNFVQVMKAI